MSKGYVAANVISGLEVKPAKRKADGSLAEAVPDIAIGDYVELDDKVAAPFVAAGALVLEGSAAAKQAEKDGEAAEALAEARAAAAAAGEKTE